MKMKKTLSLLIFALISHLGYSQTKNGEGYFRFFDQANNAKLFEMVASSASYLDYFLEEKKNFNGNDYHVRIRNYDYLNKLDTAYFREDDSNYYHFDPKNNSESIVLPKQLEMGQIWYESDRSWSYEVIGIDEVLDTPAKKYKGLIVIDCVQLNNRDKNKSNNYQMYYAKDLGLVGGSVNGILSSYLSQVVTNAKEGEKVTTKKEENL